MYSKALMFFLCENCYGNTNLSVDAFLKKKNLIYVCACVDNNYQKHTLSMRCRERQLFFNHTSLIITSDKGTIPGNPIKDNLVL